MREFPNIDHRWVIDSDIHFIDVIWNFSWVSKVTLMTVERAHFNRLKALEDIIDTVHRVLPYHHYDIFIFNNICHISTFKSIYYILSHALLKVLWDIKLHHLVRHWCHFVKCFPHFSNFDCHILCKRVQHHRVGFKLPILKRLNVRCEHFLCEWLILSDDQLEIGHPFLGDVNNIVVFWF